MKLESEHLGSNIIGKGMEYIVSRPPEHPGIVIKNPRDTNLFSMLGKDPLVVLRQELAEAKTLVEGTDLRIPRTFIYDGQEKKVLGRSWRSYTIVQKYIDEDRSISDVESHLANQGLNSLVEEYRHEPRNFISSEGVLYWVDPTKGMMGRILESTKIMKLETYRKIRRRLSNLIRFCGL